jgi:hypothetical protein
MSETEAGGSDAAAFAALKAHADALEKQLHEAEAKSAMQLRQAELKAEAVRAGIVDLDGLKLIDPAVHADADAALVITKFRREKPWLFSGASSSSAAVAPQVAPIKRKLATEMSVDEWRAARAELLRRK